MDTSRKPRKSGCARESLKGEVARLRRLTIEERIKMSLSMRGRFAWLKPTVDRGINVRSGSPLRLAPIPQLVALKLYAGGYKSKADIIELLRRNPDIDYSEVKAVCDRYRLSGLDELIEEASN